jgi:hypothetical protein
MSVLISVFDTVDLILHMLHSASSWKIGSLAIQSVRIPSMNNIIFLQVYYIAGLPPNNISS